MASSEKKAPEKSRRNSRVFWACVFGLLIVLLWLLRNCEKPPWEPALPPPQAPAVEKPLPPEPAPDTPSVQADTQPPLKPVLISPPPEPALDSVVKDTIEEVSLEFAGTKIEDPLFFVDTLFVYADPWGGRHFDSVTVRLFCRENCLILYSFGDSANLKSYDSPLVITTNKTLWIAGINEKGEQTEPVKVNYIIERKNGNCPENTMPFALSGKAGCIDVYEWPNRSGEIPASFVNQGEAARQCAQAGKRLCTLEEWQTVCRGPENLKYPYGNRYDENYCAAKEKKAQRTGRYPVCRSYYGAFDLSGNVWEWTGTAAPEKDGHYWVVGGNWDSGNQATCEEKKFSFFPQNRYPFVGFRCCLDL